MDSSNSDGGARSGIGISRRSIVAGAAAATFAGVLSPGGRAAPAALRRAPLIDVTGNPSTIELDHVSLGTANLYTGAQSFFEATGLGSYEGGWFPGSGIANRIVPLGADQYVEIESCIDVHAQDAPSQWFKQQTANGDVFLGWCLRVSSLEELDRIARRLGTKIVEGSLRTRPDGSRPVAIRTPESFEAWPKGLPSFFYVGDRTHHPSRLPVSTPNPASGSGIAWMEVGGTRKAMQDWLGIDPDLLGLRCNGGAPGLYAMGIKVRDAVVEIRHRPISL